MKKILIILGILLGAIPTASAQGYEFEIIDQFIADITIHQDSSISVTEKILYNFGSEERHGIIRDIPISYGTNGEFTIQLDVLSITDEFNTPYIYQEEGYSTKSLRIGDPDETITGQHWYYISYNFAPAVTGFEEHDELYWNVTGNGWSIPISYAEANITIETSEKSPALIATCFSGYLGSTDANCNSEIINNKQYRFVTTQYLEAFEGLTIVAGFQKGIVTPPTILKVDAYPTWSEVYIDGDYSSDYYDYTPYSTIVTPGPHEVEVKKSKYVSQSKTINVKEGQTNEVYFELVEAFWVPYVETYIPFAIFFLGTILIIAHWYKHGKEPQKRGTIMPDFNPPDKLSPGEIGVIIDQKAHLHDISASIINLAVKGYLKIKREEGKSKRKPKFTFIKTKNLSKSHQTLTIFEKSIHKEIFDKSDKVKLTDLNNKFYKKLPKIKKQLYQAVVRKKYFTKNPDKVRKKYIGIGLAGLFISQVAGAFLVGLTDSFLYGISFFWLSAVVLLVSIWMPRRTKKGMSTYEKILGLKMYLATAEKHRFKKLHSPKNFLNHFEKLLPYAIALEVEKEWAKQFKGLFKGAPSWYIGNQFSAIDLTNSLTKMRTQAQGNFTSRPGSSGGGSGWSGGSSGFSSGGFSGGGSGGGGGSSW